MILTRMRLNGRRRGTHKLLGSPEAMHAAMASAFPPGVDPGRILWRVDGRQDPISTLYVVSRARPDLSHVVEQAGWPEYPTIDTADYGPFLDRLAVGQRWAFGLTANPTHRAADQAGRVMAHVTADQQLGWLVAKADRLGIRLTDPEGRPTCSVVGRDVWQFRRQDAKVTLGVASFTGECTVVDAELLRAALTQGIGRAKAYGCGLMTLARP